MPISFLMLIKSNWVWLFCISHLSSHSVRFRSFLFVFDFNWNQKFENSIGNFASVKENRIRLGSKIVPKYLHENKFHFESQFEISISAKRRKCINFYFFFLFLPLPHRLEKTIGIYLICQWQLDFLFHKCNTGWKKIREWRKANDSHSLSLSHSPSLSHTHTTYVHTRTHSTHIRITHTQPFHTHTYQPHI